MKKYLIPALLMLLIGAPLAWSDSFFNQFVPNSPLLTSPALSGDVFPIVRAGATFRVPLAGRGVVTLTRPLSGALDATIPWIVTRPDFAVQNCTGTTSSCFNEAEADAFVAGWNVVVQGCGEYLGQGSNNLLCNMAANSSAGFVLKPLANRSLTLIGVQMTCNGAANQGCVNVDSMMKGHIFCQGCEIVSEPTSADAANTCAWRFKPTNAMPNEAIIGVQDSTVELGNFGVQPASGTAHAALCIDLTNGGFNNMIVRGNEASTGGAGNVPLGNYTIAIEKSDNPANASFAFNHLTFGHVHFALLAGILNGGVTNQTKYTSNIWNVGALYPARNGALGLDTYASNEQWTVGVINNNENASGSYLQAIQIEAAAAANKFSVGTITGASGASGMNPGINDLSGLQNSYAANGLTLEEWRGKDEFNYFAPTSCTANAGATCGVGTNASNTNGPLNITVANPTTITLNFSHTYRGNPVCGVAGGTGVQAGFQTAQTTSSVTWTFPVTPGISTVNYTNCHGEGL